jgi:hypothetical protein
MFGRGRLDHLALEAASLEAFDEIRDRLLAREATAGFVTDFGHILSLFFRDPDGLEADVCTEPGRPAHGTQSPGNASVAIPPGRDPTSRAAHELAPRYMIPTTARTSRT